jgi:3-methyladenine DNA glycosylase AlkD
VNERPTAQRFLVGLVGLRSQSSPGKVPMRDLFALAKSFIDMDVTDIEVLLEDSAHDTRVGAVSIMDWKARRKATGDAERRALYELYLRRHDRIDNWDLVDRSAPYVVGGYLADRPRDVLRRLARSESQWERRSAIVATYYFIRQGDLDDTFDIAEILVNDPEDLVQKAVGGWIREAGKRDEARLVEFLDRHAATMPRTALRYAVERFDDETRKHYLSLRSRSDPGHR